MTARRGQGAGQELCNCVPRVHLRSKAGSGACRSCCVALPGQKGALMHSAVPTARCLQRGGLLLLAVPPHSIRACLQRRGLACWRRQHTEMCHSHRVDNGTDCRLSWLALAGLLSPACCGLPAGARGGVGWQGLNRVGWSRLGSGCRRAGGRTLHGRASVSMCAKVS